MKFNHYVIEDKGIYNNIEDAEKAISEPVVRRWWVSFYKDPGDPGWEEPFDTVEEAHQAVIEFMETYPNGEWGQTPEYYNEEETW